MPSNNWDLLNDDDIDMAYAGGVESVPCVKCGVDMPLDQGTAALGGGYLCPYDDGIGNAELLANRRAQS